MLGNEVARCGVQRTGEERGEEEVEQGVEGEILREEGDEGVVEAELDEDIEGVDPGQRDAVDNHRPQGVEEDLEGAEEGLSEDRVEEYGLEGGGEIGVEAIDAERLVVR